MSAGGPIGRREVAVRCFAAEYDDATLEYSEGDDERAPNYVVTPTGARINRLFVVGVLTEVEAVSDDVLRGRVVDPTGAFVVYAGQYQPDAKAALAGMEPPTFVAVTGKARTFRPDDGDRVYTSVRPESVNAVDAATRDRWTVQAAEQTVDRVAACAAALAREERGEDLTAVLIESGVDPGLAAGIPRAIDHYGTTEAYLSAVRTLALQAAEVVAGEREEVDPLSVAPDEAGPVEAELAARVTLSAPASAGPAATEATHGGGQDAPREGAAPAAEEGSEEEVESVAVEPSGADADAEPPAADAPAPDGDPDELYEIDDAEREAIEAEFGTEFETGNEVAEPGQADIETPGPESGEEVPAGPEAEAEATPDAEAGAPSDSAERPSEDVAGGAESDEEEADEADGVEEGVAEADDTEAAEAEDEESAGADGADGVEEAAAESDEREADEADLVDAAVAAMADLDDGDGADHEAVVAAVADERGVDEGLVEDAIEEALMGGRCYEPDDGRLKAI